MEVPSFKENHVSQLPALMLLQKLGYTYLSPEKADEERGGKKSQVLLENILRQQLKKINAAKRLSSTRTVAMSDANIENGIRALKMLPFNEGYNAACASAYNLLTIGRAFDQMVDGEKKSITLQYVDWTHPENNVFHVTEEFQVLRNSRNDHYRPDIVLFLNGIPICIIECKRPDAPDAIPQAISQTLRNQQEDGIPHCYAYSQLLLCIAHDSAVYGTNNTPAEYMARWKEQHPTQEAAVQEEARLLALKNQPLTPDQAEALFARQYRYVRKYMEHQYSKEVTVSEQDRYLYALCRPERLLELIEYFILFDYNTKKIARYQQYFAVKKTMQRLRHLEHGRRKGGVIWHTQGSGKSLTMFMIAQAIAKDPSIKHPKIVLVTDRTELDDQIQKTFLACKMPVMKASTGKELLELLESKTDTVITTVINKFTAAVDKKTIPLDSHDIFVLVDEGHRSQYKNFNKNMQRTLPNACYIAMTGTPLFKKEKNTAEKFGGIIDAYTVLQAVEDGAVVPLLYEGRMAAQEVNARAIDDFFNKVTEPMNEYERADFKKKYSRSEHLNSAEQKMYAIAMDISTHFSTYWKHKGVKAQLVCDKKTTAIKYKELLDSMKMVTSEVLISQVDDREGHDSVYESSTQLVQAFWKKMMAQYQTPGNYQKTLIQRFKETEEPDIIIVVDKLLTGFDAPKNTILYLTRNLESHKLLQAIARVNRVYKNKEFGYIIDYYGVVENLDTALNMYSNLGDYDQEDLQGNVTSVQSEIDKLPQKHADLLELFKSITNKLDVEAYAQLLRDEALRNQFYDLLLAYRKCLEISDSSLLFEQTFTAAEIKTYKDHLAFFKRLREQVVSRYSDEIEYRKYEVQVQRLIDMHVSSGMVEPITKLVNIFDKEAFEAELAQCNSVAARADTIASRTAKYIAVKMDEDPAFYKKFSQLLRETIADYEARRISELQYLEQARRISEQVQQLKDDDTPAVLSEHVVARAFYGLAKEAFKAQGLSETDAKQTAAQAALGIDQLIRNTVFENGVPMIDWEVKSNVSGQLMIAIGDFLLDEIIPQYQLNMTYEATDELAQQILEVAKKRYKA